MIERTFQNISDSKPAEADQQPFLTDLDRSEEIMWKDLLQSKRVLIISEAGAGKTYECKKKAKDLWNAGEPAFYIELSELGGNNLRNQLDIEEGRRLDSWVSSQSDIATFFLDSIDELKLTRKSFRNSLIDLKKNINNQLRRTRIILTTRPIPIDEKLVRQLLPVPPSPLTIPKETAFADIAMGNWPARRVRNEGEDVAPDWRTVGLIPLSNPQIIQFAQDQGVNNPEALLDDLERRNAWEFAKRPQDLIELCADWREHNRIRTHREQVATNVKVKLKPREDRPEPAELSIDQAVEGASRLALAMQVTRRMTIRHSAESDEQDNEAALDPEKILSDWKPNERKALLERPLFGFASYGRVRFHHRSVTEYLATERLLEFRRRGMPLRTLKRLLFTQSSGETIALPSKRPIAGWLALEENRVFEILRDCEPAVLFTEGDSETLTPAQRIQVLRSYVERHGPGGRRRLNVPHIQIHRFSSQDLGDEINRLWKKGIENPDVREMLLSLVEAGRIRKCADIAHEIACDSKSSLIERVIAVDALAAVDDARTNRVASSVATSRSLWPDKVALAAVLKLFPRHFSIDQFCQLLGRIREGKHSADLLRWHLPHLITRTELGPQKLVELRNGLVKLVSFGLCWQDEQSSIGCNQPQLGKLLATTCLKGLDRSKDDDWLYASVLALCLLQHKHGYDETYTTLDEHLKNLSDKENERLFWIVNDLIQSLHVSPSPWQRFTKVAGGDGVVKLRAERDLSWIRRTLGDTSRSTGDRAMLLEAAMSLVPDPNHSQNHVSKLKPLVADTPELILTINEQLNSPKPNKTLERLDKEWKERKRQEELENKEARESWVQFWHEVAETPELAFSDQHSRNTAYRLWQAMKHDGDYSQTTGWNRRFIEKQFGKETADQLRQTLMKFWRNEQPDDQHNIISPSCELGLSAIYAEAENSSWANGLTREEAELAAHYAAIELNGLPRWIDDLVDTHPETVDTILGNKLSLELQSSLQGNGRSMLLQSISYAPKTVARLFFHRLQEWLDRIGEIVDVANDIDSITQQVIDVLLKHGDADIHAYIRKIADRHLKNNPPEKLAFVWLPALMRVDPAHGVSVLEDRIREEEPRRNSKAVEWFSVLFGDFYDAVNLPSPTFTPELLLKLIRLAYQHVRPSDDIQHEGVYSLDIRDRAQRARNVLVEILLNTKGEDGWKAKLEIADDPFCLHFRDKILAVAQENRALELDSHAYDEKEASILDKTCEAPASTTQDMFIQMCDRLDDLDELLQSDFSPRETWALINKEKLMRREVARELHYNARGIYKVDQESVTGDEKETDIRLRSTVSDCEAVIELKLADKCSARELRDTIRDQLIRKYMVPQNRKSGCLLMTRAKKKKWKHPENGNSIAFEGLVVFLKEEANRAAESAGVLLCVHTLDLLPQWSSEQTTIR